MPQQPKLLSLENLDIIKEYIDEQVKQLNNDIRQYIDTKMNEVKEKSDNI